MARSRRRDQPEGMRTRHRRRWRANLSRGAAFFWGFWRWGEGLSPRDPERSGDAAGAVHLDVPALRSQVGQVAPQLRGAQAEQLLQLGLRHRTFQKQADQARGAPDRRQLPTHPPSLTSCAHRMSGFKGVPRAGNVCLPEGGRPADLRRFNGAQHGAHRVQTPFTPNSIEKKEAAGTTPAARDFDPADPTIVRRHRAQNLSRKKYPPQDGHVAAQRLALDDAAPRQPAAGPALARAQKDAAARTSPPRKSTPRYDGSAWGANAPSRTAG